MSARESRPATVVEEIVSSLCAAIFRGEHRPGEKLPPLRTLAKTYSVTLPTMQRVIARMEELGLITVRQGSGVTVLEPLSHAHPSAIPYWFDAYQDDPDKAVSGLSDFLELRTEMAVTILLKIRPLLDRPEGESVEAQLCDFEDRAEEMTPQEAFEADFDLMRSFLALRPQLAHSTVLNVLARIVAGLPGMVDMIYDHPVRNAMGYRTVLSLARERRVTNADLREQVTGVLRAFDTITLGKFRALLEMSSSVA